MVKRRVARTAQSLGVPLFRSDSSVLFPRCAPASPTTTRKPLFLSNANLSFLRASLRTVDQAEKAVRAGTRRPPLPGWERPAPRAGRRGAPVAGAFATLRRRASTTSFSITSSRRPTSIAAARSRTTPARSRPRTAPAGAPRGKRPSRPENPGLGPRSVDVPHVGRVIRAADAVDRALGARPGLRRSARARRPARWRSRTTSSGAAYAARPRRAGRSGSRRPAGRRDARSRDSRQTDRQDPRGVAALPPGDRPFLFVGGAVGADDPLHRSCRSIASSATSRSAGLSLGRGILAGGVGGGLRREPPAPTMGETSGAVCRLAGFGLPLVVSDTGWFRELPDAFASKVPVGGDEASLAAEMAALARARADAGTSRGRVRWGEARRPDRVAGLRRAPA